MQNVSAVQIQDSDATPKDAPASQYSVNASMVRWWCSMPRRRPVYRAVHRRLRPWRGAESTAMFTQPLPERWICFEGLNTADGNREVVIDLYRVAINPARNLDHHGRTAPVRAFGPVLADLTKPVGGDLGQFWSSGAAVMDGFKNLPPEPVVVTLSGTALELTPIRLGELPRLLAVVRPLAEEITSDPDWMALLGTARRCRAGPAGDHHPARTRVDQRPVA